MRGKTLEAFPVSSATPSAVSLYCKFGSSKTAASWRPTLRPYTALDEGGNGDSSGKRCPQPQVQVDAGSQRVEGQLPDRTVAPSSTSSLSVDEGSMNDCIRDFLRWLNDDHFSGNLCATTHETQLMSVINDAAGIKITRCSAGELPAIRNPWGDRACPVTVVAAWCIDSSRLSWTCENWRSELCLQESLLICSTALQSGDGSKQHDARHLLICRFFADEQAVAGNIADGHYYVISCPSSVLPLRFATAVPTLSQPPWRLEHKQVMPLPGQID